MLREKLCYVDQNSILCWYTCERTCDQSKVNKLPESVSAATYTTRNDLETVLKDFRELFFVWKRDDNYWHRFYQHRLTLIPA